MVSLLEGQVDSLHGPGQQLAVLLRVGVHLQQSLKRRLIGRFIITEKAPTTRLTFVSSSNLQPARPVEGAAHVLRGGEAAEAPRVRGQAQE